MKRISLLQAFALCIATAIATPRAAIAMPRERYNFNSDWCLTVGDPKGAEQPKFDDAQWTRVTLPHAWNEDEAFAKHIAELSTGIAWYRKHFTVPAEAKGGKVFVEFEGVRQAGEFYVNGKYIGIHENGVMAVGFDITPYVKFGKENVIAVRTDNDWSYRQKVPPISADSAMLAQSVSPLSEPVKGAGFQWNNKNFNANYGGIPKNVFLHITGAVYQTLPLFSNLGTTGVYVYADNIAVRSRTADIHAEAEVRNESRKPASITFEVHVKDIDGKEIARFNGAPATIAAGETKTVSASASLAGLHFWSWGYGYLYTVETVLKSGEMEIDKVSTKTGFRKTRFADGMVWLNDRVLQMKGYAQRTSNEWPAVGMSVPAWLSDYSNDLMVQSNANLVRWMHVTPWKQDIESCDRVGLIQAMPAGDAEKDIKGLQWVQRTQLMRDAIIYNRNNPSILFYECGNESISEEHIAEMKAIRDRYDPHGGRAIGSREMLDSKIAEYGGEMLYINKSAHIPMWAMEYERDEGLRKYWDSYSYPYHRDGAGPLYRRADASVYNRNQDSHAIENIVRWFDYWRVRPGTGRRVSSGGVKIIFSDSNTHQRGEENYRRSGVTDPMRLPKDGYWTHQIMWDGWVDVDATRVRLMGHWNYPAGTVKDIFATASNAGRVELFVNGKSKGLGQQSHEFLYTFKDVAYEAGEVKAVAYDKLGRAADTFAIETAGAPADLRMSVMHGPHGLLADGADMALVEVEVVDAKGRRCPLANNLVRFDLKGPAEWRGGIAQVNSEYLPDSIRTKRTRMMVNSNYILEKTLPVECGVTRVLVRSTTTAGAITLTATARDINANTQVSFSSTPVESKGGLSTTMQADLQPCRLGRGETLLTPSYTITRVPVEVASATAGANSADAVNSYDDNELSEWRNDGRLGTGWITYELQREASINEVELKLTGWRQRSYPLDIYVDSTLVYSGNTEKSLGYISIPVKEVRGRRVTIRLTGSASDKEAFGQVTELEASQELDLLRDRSDGKGQLRIVEAEFYEDLRR